MPNTSVKTYSVTQTNLPITGACLVEKIHHVPTINMRVPGQVLNLSLFSLSLGCR